MDLLASKKFSFQTWIQNKLTLYNVCVVVHLRSCSALEVVQYIGRFHQCIGGASLFMGDVILSALRNVQCKVFVTARNSNHNISLVLIISLSSHTKLYSFLYEGGFTALVLKTVFGTFKTGIEMVFDVLILQESLCSCFCGKFVVT